MFFFSILLPCYNETSLLKRSIESIIHQSFKNFELIIINDGSTNNDTIEIIDNYKKYKYIKIIHNKKNIGLTNSLIRASKYCSGNYIIRQDADDYSHKDRLNFIHSYLQKNQNTDLLFCSFYKCKNGKIYNPYVSYLYLLPKNFLIKLLPFFNIFVHGTFCISNECLKSIGYNFNFKFSQDYKFTLDSIKSRKNLNILNQRLYFLNTQKNNISNKHAKDQIFYDLLAKMNYFFENNIDIKKNIFQKLTLYFLIMLLVLIRRTFKPVGSIQMFKELCSH